MSTPLDALFGNSRDDQTDELHAESGDAIHDNVSRPVPPRFVVGALLVNRVDGCSVGRERRRRSAPVHVLNELTSSAIVDGVH
jgi:hypothetical protein